jgi:hypothetical protein
MEIKHRSIIAALCVVTCFSVPAVPVLLYDIKEGFDAWSAVVAASKRF